MDDLPFADEDNACDNTFYTMPQAHSSSQVFSDAKEYLWANQQGSYIRGQLR